MDTDFQASSISSLKNEYINEKELEEAPFLWLPEEVHMYILTFLEAKDLGKVCQISHYFNRLSMDDAIWSCVTSLTFPSYLPKEKIMHYIFKCSELLSLNCASCTDQLDDASAQEVFKYSPHLRTLDISRCENVSEGALASLVEYCTDLRYLDVSHNVHVKEDTFMELLKKCQKLQSLKLNSCSLSLYGPLDTELVSPYLHTLQISKAVFDPAFSDSLKDVFPNVRYLNLAGTSLDTRSLETHIPALLELEYLDVSKCPNLIDVNNFRHDNLRTLKLNGCSTLGSLNVQCNELSTIELSDCYSLTEVNFVLPKVKHLNLEGLLILDTVQFSMPSLQVLSVSSCAAISDTCLLRICSNAHVQDLSVVNCARVSAEGLTKASQHSPVLRRLAVQQSKIRELQLASKTLQELIVEEVQLNQIQLLCPNLQHLVMKKCPELTDECVQSALSKCNTSLLTIDLSHSPRVSFEALKSVVDVNSCLQSIKLENCPWVNVVTINSTALRELNLASCSTLEAVNLDCSNLSALHLSWCTKLNTVKVVAPKLETLDVEGSCSSLINFKVDSRMLKQLELKAMLKPTEITVHSPLEILRLTKSLHVTEEIVNNIIATSPTLKHIDLSGCKNIQTLSLKSLAHLQTISVTEMRSLSKIELGPDVTNLEEIQIAWCGKLKGSDIKDLVHAASSLKRLKLRGCPGIVEVQLTAPQLEYLCLEKCLALSSLSLDCPCLYRIEIKGCSALKRAYLKSKYVKVLDMDPCPKLTYIHFDSFANVTTSFVKRLHSVAPNLSNLNLKGSKVEDESVNYVLDKLVKFEKLVLNDCAISDDLRKQKRQKVEVV